MIEKKYTDRDGDEARFRLNVDPENAAERNEVWARDVIVYLTDDNLRDLRAAIDEHLGDRPKPRPASALAAEAMLRASNPLPSRAMWTFPPEPKPEPKVSALSAIEAVVSAETRTAAVKAIIEEARA